MGWTYTQEEIKKSNENNLKPGKYKAVVEQYEETLSSKEQEMIKLKCKVIGPEEAGKVIYINIVKEWAWSLDMIKKVTGIEEFQPGQEIGEWAFLSKEFWFEKKPDSDFPKLLKNTDTNKNETKVMDTTLDNGDDIPF